MLAAKQNKKRASEFHSAQAFDQSMSSWAAPVDSEPSSSWKAAGFIFLFGEARNEAIICAEQDCAHHGAARRLKGRHHQGLGYD
ncbi:hypothetical protein OJAV_G00024760 [Oryzias javanicus]|uniref:Uncharacterized protein n=1 Tax=Oryzias javanicus TaxID=123683 RepID=A0A3S2PIV9_ORYJA|nr:hypothetical protein OJAV_G00024760 [Oryzias javanicus]